MKKLFLLRHAKSSWDDPGLADFDRPLNERGLKAAPRMGRLMRERKVKPDLVLCSPAERARQTAALALEAAGLKPELRYDERIYEATVGQLLEVVSGVGDEIEAALLVGHNYAIENLLAHLTDEAQHMPTAALACVSLPLEKWGEIHGAKGRLEWFVKPRELAKG
ncbi:MAG: SixA phosphatase family protein [Pyrinomonadaceae bacterium]